MRTVCDEFGRQYLLLKESGESSLVRDPASGERRYVANDELSPATGESPLATAARAVPDPVRALFERIDVGYYEADAAEITSLELDKVAGVEAALEVLGVDDPFVMVLGDSKSDLRVMEWAARNDCGIAAAPEHASAAVLDHVRSTSDLVFPPGDAAVALRLAYALNELASPE